MMKKISLKNLDLTNVEQLSRDQLKDVLGGASGSGGSDELNKYAKACENKSDGNSCIVDGYNRSGQCRYGLTGPLVCTFY